MESLIALVESGEDGRLRVLSPKLGFFVPAVDIGAVVSTGVTIGHLRILNHRVAIVLPSEVAGRVIGAVQRPGQGVEYRGLLLGLSTDELAMSVSSANAASASSLDGGEVIRAPIHGIFYLRPSPGAPSFVSPGQPLRRGQTVGLIEVMKTFNPVVFDGPGIPDSAEFAEALAKDQQEVEAGQPLLRWRPTTG